MKDRAELESGRLAKEESAVRTVELDRGNGWNIYNVTSLVQISFSLSQAVITLRRTHYIEPIFNY